MERLSSAFYLSDWARVFQSISTMLDRGFSLRYSIDAIANHPFPPAITARLMEIQRSLASGESVLMSLAPTLSMLMRYSVSTDFHIGNLSAFFRDISHMLSRRDQHLRYLLKELSYPAFLLATLLSCIVLIVIFIIPLFISFFTDFNIPAPSFIHWLYEIRYRPFSISFFSAVLAISLSTLVVIVKLSQMLYKKINHPYLLSSYLRGWAVLLDGGISVKKSLTIFPPPFLSQGDYERMVTHIYTTGDVVTPLSLAIKLSHAQHSLLVSGWTFGTFSDALTQVSEALYQIAQFRIGRLIALVKPILLLLLGVLIFGMVQLLLLPLIQSTSIL